MQKVVIDCEFTGLDNTYVSDNEIVQVKMMNLRTQEVHCRSYGSKKPIGAYGQLLLGVKRYDEELFDKTMFRQQLEAISIKPSRKTTFYGYGVQQDISMLAKYDVHIDIVDIRGLLQRSRFAERMATEGSGLESAYLIVFGKKPDSTTHDGPEELQVIYDLYRKAIRLKKQEHIDVMPHGHCAGMPLREYVQKYRRAADGYRHNNVDLLSASLTASIPRYVPRDDDDEWDEDELDDDDF
jgi:hypothetical protein